MTERRVPLPGELLKGAEAAAAGYPFRRRWLSRTGYECGVAVSNDGDAVFSLGILLPPDHPWQPYREVYHPVWCNAHHAERGCTCKGCTHLREKDCRGSCRELWMLDPPVDVHGELDDVEVLPDGSRWLVWAVDYGYPQHPDALFHFGWSPTPGTLTDHQDEYDANPDLSESDVVSFVYSELGRLVVQVWLASQPDDVREAGETIIRDTGGAQHWNPGLIWELSHLMAGTSVPDWPVQW